MTAPRWSCLIEKDNIANIHIQENLGETDLNQGEIEVAVKCYALTANNITYATLGKSFGSWTDMPGYWAFFPSVDEGFGQLPIWGFAEVVKSNHADFKTGEEFYGYFPMASHLVMTPGKISPVSFHDFTDHRTKLAPIYNQYTRVNEASGIKDDEKDLWPVFRPLLITGYMICDQFNEADYYGAEQLVIVSASSKTAMMTARCFDQFDRKPKLIGLTSTGNKQFVEQSGLYDEVLTYGDVATIDNQRATALIDMAGNGAVIDALHHHFTDNLKFSCLVGLSHWDSARPSRNLPGASVVPFFAPGRLKQRSADWGSDELQSRLGSAWDSFIALAPSLTTIKYLYGAEDAVKVYGDLIKGTIDPSQSLIIK
ncbi:MAG: DUF2855 family protein, partial [Sneathiella sp.]|nr:DUF2855 family protein [Sneathiella sp.]